MPGTFEWHGDEGGKKRCVASVHWTSSKAKADDQT